jgi:hypothetical protein
MASPVNPLKVALVSRLRANSSLEAIVGNRIYDRVLSNPAPSFPYLRYDVSDAVADDVGEAGCNTRRWVVNVDVHVWSRAVGRVEADNVAGLVRACLDAITSVTGFKLRYNQFRQVRTLDDPDGVTTHAIVSSEFLLTE